MLLEFIAVALLVFDAEVIAHATSLPQSVSTVSLVLIAVAPVLIAVASVIRSSFSWGVKYIIMASASEDLRSEIFRYRARAGRYRDKYFASRRLAHAMGNISQSVVKSECQNIALKSLDPPKDPYHAPEQDILILGGWIGTLPTAQTYTAGDLCILRLCRTNPTTRRWDSEVRLPGRPQQP